MKWTSEPPKERGWYWVFPRTDCPPIIVELWDHPLRVSPDPRDPDSEDPRAPRLDNLPRYRWAGPIPEPEE